MACAMMLWAVVSALTAVSKDFTGLLLTRFFLGVTEAPYYPGAVYLLSIFYTRKEVATRIAILYTGNILATAFAGLIAAGIFHGMDDVGGLSGWKWLFILQGAVTFVIAIVGFFVLPDFPHDTKWLTPDERLLATSRMELDTVGNQGETSTWKGFQQAAKDPMVWIFALMAHMQYVQPLYPLPSLNDIEIFMCPTNHPAVSPPMASKTSSLQSSKHWASTKPLPWFSPALPTSSPVLSPSPSHGAVENSTNAHGTSLSPKPSQPLDS